MPSELTDRYDVDAAGTEFAICINGGLNFGEFFRDSTGIRWKYLAFTDGKYIACHGEFGLVMTLTDLGEGRTKIDSELKKIKQESTP